MPEMSGVVTNIEKSCCSEDDSITCDIIIPKQGTLALKLKGHFFIDPPYVGMPLTIDLEGETFGEYSIKSIRESKVT